MHEVASTYQCTAFLDCLIKWGLVWLQVCTCIFYFKIYMPYFLMTMDSTRCELFSIICFSWMYFYFSQTLDKLPCGGSIAIDSSGIVTAEWMVGCSPWLLVWCYWHVIAWMHVHVFAVYMDFTQMPYLSFIFFPRGAAEFQMLSGFMFHSSPPYDCHPIITLTYVLIPNYKPVTRLIFSYRHRARSAMQEFRWTLGPDFCIFFPL